MVRGMVPWTLTTTGAYYYQPYDHYKTGYVAYISLLVFVVLFILLFFLTAPTFNSTPAPDSNMGALCEKQSVDPFSTPGRTLAAAPPAATTSAVPASARRKSGATKSSNATGPTAAGVSTETGAGAGVGPAEARNQAALAAERRATDAKKPQGKLAARLNRERGATQAELLKRQADENKVHRALDATAKTLRHD